MNREQLYEQIRKKRSFLCVGLDTDWNKIPKSIRLDYPEAGDAIFEFNRAIILNTQKYAVAYKPNIAFYESYGSEGIRALERTCKYIKDSYPEIFIILDAKRGDIGNTSAMYAEAFFGEYTTSDAVTLAPYMGRDTVDPFLKYEDKWAVILALTSNPSADDFETQPMADGRPLWKHVLEKAKTWGCEPHGQLKSSTNEDRVMFVVGATRAETLKEVREIVPDHFLLVPGVGAQGGSLEEVARHGLNPQCGLLVNSSRAIIYADHTEHFAEAAAEAARDLASRMSALL